MMIEELDLGRGDACVLELHRRSLLTPEDDRVGTLDADGACAYVQVSIGFAERVRANQPLFTASPAYSTWKT